MGKNSNGATLGPNLPWELGTHCVTKMNTSHYIIIGGYLNDYPKRTIMVNFNTLEMTRGPDLAGSGRTWHVCAHIRHNNGTNYVIAAGGQHSNNAKHKLDDSEIFNVDNPSNVWYPGINI